MISGKLPNWRGDGRRHGSSRFAGTGGLEGATGQGVVEQPASARSNSAKGTISRYFTDYLHFDRTFDGADLGDRSSDGGRYLGVLKSNLPSLFRRARDDVRQIRLTQCSGIDMAKMVAITKQTESAKNQYTPFDKTQIGCRDEIGKFNHLDLTLSCRRRT